MKTNAVVLKGWLHGSCTWLSSTALLLAGAASALAQSEFPTPVGTWDCVVSGAQQGLAFLTFDKDFSISGYEVITFNPKNPTDNPRGIGSDIGRGVTVSPNTS